MLSLTVNDCCDITGYWTFDMNNGLAEDTSLTSLSLTVNNYSYVSGEWAHGPCYGLAKNSSLTTLCK